MVKWFFAKFNACKCRFDKPHESISFSVNWFPAKDNEWRLDNFDKFANCVIKLWLLNVICIFYKKFLILIYKVTITC